MLPFVFVFILCTFFGVFPMYFHFLGGDIHGIQGILMDYCFCVRTVTVIYGAVDTSASAVGAATAPGVSTTCVIDVAVSCTTGRPFLFFLCPLGLEYHWGHPFVYVRTYTTTNTEKISPHTSMRSVEIVVSLASLEGSALPILSLCQVGYACEGTRPPLPGYISGRQVKP